MRVSRPETEPPSPSSRIRTAPTLLCVRLLSATGARPPESAVRGPNNTRLGSLVMAHRVWSSSPTGTRLVPGRWTVRLLMDFPMQAMACEVPRPPLGAHAEPRGRRRRSDDGHPVAKLGGKYPQEPPGLAPTEAGHPHGSIVRLARLRKGPFFFLLDANACCRFL